MTFDPNTDTERAVRELTAFIEKEARLHTLERPDARV